MKSDMRNRTESSRSNNRIQQLAEQKSPGFVAEFFDFILHNKKWWLTPIIIALLLLSLIAILSGTGAAPFIYTLFRKSPAPY